MYAFISYFFFSLVLIFYPCISSVYLTTLKSSNKIYLKNKWTNNNLILCNMQKPIIILLFNQCEKSYSSPGEILIHNLRRWGRWLNAWHLDSLLMPTSLDCSLKRPLISLFHHCKLDIRGLLRDKIWFYV